MSKKNRFCRKATKGSNKNLGKGQSSSSNPKTKKFRNMAKGGLGKDKSSLTLQALQHHNQVYNKVSNDNMDVNDDTKSLGVESFASMWSECSNVCFDRLLRNWQSSSALHKEMLSVLAAVTEIIKSNGGKETETEYFAALVTALETAETDESVTAILSLLTLVMKRVTPSVLKLKFSETSKILITFLEKYENTVHQALVRGIIQCIAILLRHQEAAIWNLPLTLKIYNNILVLTTHSKPKLRKAAQHAVCSILKGSDIVIQGQNITCHPASTMTSKFCIKSIEENGGGKNSTATLHVLGLLKEILCVFPTSQLKLTCEVILKIMTLGNALVISCSLQALHGMFKNISNRSNLTAELNAQIINVSKNNANNVTDNTSKVTDEVTSAKDDKLDTPKGDETWISVQKLLKQAVDEVIKRALPTVMSGQNQVNISGGCMGSLMQFIFDLRQMKLWALQSHPFFQELIIHTNNLRRTATQHVSTLLRDCIQKCVENPDFDKTSTKFTMVTSKLFQSIERGLKYQYHLAWAHVINIIGVCFEILGKYHTPVTIKCLQSLADLRDSINFTHTKVLDQTVGKAVASMGPDVVLNAIPLNLNLDSNKFDFARSWLLPVIRDNVKETKLEFFTNYFLPLATKIQKKVTQCQHSNHNIEAQLYSAVQSQIIQCIAILLRHQEAAIWNLPLTLKIYNNILVLTTHSKPKLRKAAQHAVCSILKGSDIVIQGQNITCHPASTMTSKFCIKSIEENGGGKNSTATLHVLGLLKEILCVFPTSQLKLTCEVILKIMTLGNALVISCSLQALHGMFKNISNRSNLTAELNAQIINTLLRDCIQKCVENPDFDKTSTKFTMVTSKLFQSIERGLKYQYHLAWAHVINIIGVCFEILGKYHTPVTIKCLQSLADLRDSINFTHTKVLDQTVGKAVASMGPDVVLNAIPLNLNLDSNKFDFARSWLLPVIRDNVKETKLEFFTNYFLPLATKIQKKVTQCQHSNHNIEAQLYSAVQSQIWSMLPGFCTNPVDFPQSFKGIAKILGTALNTRPDLRLDVMAALRNLIKKNLNNDVNRKEMTRYAKNFLPILFNLYTTEPKDDKEESTRLAVFDTIKIYLQVSEKELCETLFQKAEEKLKDLNITSFNRYALLDICRALIPFINENHIQFLFSYCVPLLQNLDRTIQKKSYRVLEEICKNNTEGCQFFIKNHICELKELLISSLSSSSPSSKAPRLRCLRNLVCQLDKDNIEFVKIIIPEAVFCIKENSEKVREAAYNLIVEIGNYFLQWHSENPSEGIKIYIEVLLAGLAGNPHFVGATVLCLGRVIFEFKDKIPSDLIHLIIENAEVLLTSSSREIIQSALSFIKSLFGALEVTDLAQHVEIFVKNIIKAISKDGQRQLRFKAREILTRFIRKFGFDMISKYVPESHKKYINNIYKVEVCKHKNKLENKELKKNKQEDSDEETSEDNESNNKVSQKNTKEWIQENNEDIVDFLSSSVNKKILATKPKKPKKDEFKVSSDGKLIITDDCDDDKVLKHKSKLSLHCIHRKINKKEDSPTYGEEFKAKKAGGDIKIKGRPNPYAYIKLDKKVLGKRKRAKLAGQYKGIVKAAKKGSQQAKKEKHRRRKAGGDIKIKGRPNPYAYIKLDKKVLGKRKRAKLAGQYKGIVKAAKKGSQQAKKEKHRRRVKN
ncbi:RRP12-like protein [Centruroides sculpturatus]|uniref:RRP12-like protein n=1 Tax=Centruroides sculpturatus TaxID=218467 RepID=UPI000C6E73E8|nr:RRP12-like protein [Centruroides sculpturatus]